MQTYRGTYVVLRYFDHKAPVRVGVFGCRSFSIACVSDVADAMWHVLNHIIISNSNRRWRHTMHRRILFLHETRVIYCVLC